MSEYISHFSCSLHVGTKANAESAQSIYHDLNREYGQHGAGVLFLLSTDEVDPEILKIREFGSGEPAHVLEFARRCGKRFGLDRLWGFEWTYIRYMPTMVAFGGGAHVLNLQTGCTVNRMDTHQWLMNELYPDDSEA